MIIRSASHTSEVYSKFQNNEKKSCVNMSPEMRSRVLIGEHFSLEFVLLPWQSAKPVC